MHDGLSTLATDEYPTSLELKLRGRTIEDVTGGNVGAEARIGIGFTEGVVKRGMSLTRFADVTATNAARILGLYPKKGVIAPGSDADLVLIDPTIRKTLAKDDFHVTDYSPWEGLAGLGLAGHDPPAGQGHRGARAACSAARTTVSGSRAGSIRPCSAGRPASSPAGMTDYAGQFNPGFRLEPARVALVVVDMQYASASRHEGLGRLLKDQGRSEQGTARFDRIESVVVPTIQRLLGAFRERGLRIVYLTVGSELPDFSDLPPHMRPMAEAVGNTRGGGSTRFSTRWRPSRTRPGSTRRR